MGISIQEVMGSLVLAYIVKLLWRELVSVLRKERCCKIEILHNFTHHYGAYVHVQRTQCMFLVSARDINFVFVQCSSSLGNCFSVVL